jgi:hypothetical protein
MKQFNVKDGSVKEFFATHAVGIHQEDRCHISASEQSAYYFMKDTILVKKSEQFEPGNTLFFELFDKGRNSNKDLVNTYNYAIEEYDDVSVLLRLVDFNVTLKVL